MLTRLFVPALSLLALLGCRDAERALPDGGAHGADAETGDGGSSGSDSGPERDAGSERDGGGGPKPCPAGATRHAYSLTPLADLPEASDLDLPDLPSFVELVSAGTGLSNSVRLEVCEDESGAVSLETMLYRGSSFETARLYIVDPSVSGEVQDTVERDEGYLIEHRISPDLVAVEGLADALEGDLSGLRIRFESESGLLMAGHAGGFVAVARGMFTEDSGEYTSIYVVVGGLAPGDVFAGLECRFGEEPYTTTFTTGTADFEVDACTFLGGGATTGYRITRLAVEDSNPALDAAGQARFELDGEAEVETVMNYRYNHHNACDSFYLALPHAEYAASTAAAAGCGPRCRTPPSETRARRGPRCATGSDTAAASGWKEPSPAATTTCTATDRRVASQWDRGPDPPVQRRPAPIASHTR